jgi:hypothetical protein
MAPATTAAPRKKAAPAKKAAATKKAPAKKAPAKKAVVKTAEVKKPAPTRTPATKTPAVKRAASIPATTKATTNSWVDRLPEFEAPPVAPAPRFNKRMAVIAAGVAVAVLGTGGAAFALTRDHAPTKAKYIVTADAICRPANGPVSAIVKPTSYPELATAAGTVATTSTSQLTQLRALKRPSGADGKALDPTFTAFTATQVAAQKLADAATKHDDAAAIAATKELRAQFTDAASQSKTYGFTACGGGMQAGVDNVFNGSAGIVKAGFSAKADGLCRTAATSEDKLAEPNYSNPKDLERFLNQEIALYEKLQADLRALPVAPGDEATVAEMLDAGDKLVAKFREMRDATAALDAPHMLAAAMESEPLGTAADAKFDAYGLGTCGSNFGD